MEPALFDDAAAPLAPVEQRPAHRLVADALRRTIALGVYVPGDRIPSERELAARLGVARVTLRAAIRVLNAEGLLETSRGRLGGSVVADGPARAGIEGLAHGYVGDVREAYEFRLVNEPVAARLAAERASDEQRRRLVEIAALPFDDPATYRALDSRFHLALAAAAGNRPLLDAVARVRAQFFGWAGAVWDPAWEEFRADADASAAQHRAIAAAVAAGDGAAAAEAMRAHLAYHAARFEDIDLRLGVRRR